MAMLGQTITVINKSGKVVKTSKHITNLFNDAKAAYNERKAEIQASRRGDRPGKDELQARRRLEDVRLDDEASGRKARRASDDRKEVRRKPAPDRQRAPHPVQRSVTDSFYANDERSPNHRSQPRHASVGSSPTSDPRLGELARRHSDETALHLRHAYPPSPRSSQSSVDPDLAYGELPPPLPARKYDEEVELRAKMSGLQRLLDECNCMQHSVTAIVERLQKNPDQLAAVALTLAEISNLASKMAPSALTAMKGTFPTIIALLASPEFAIAIGVGVGVTIIALGGYKIIKKMHAKKDAHRLIEGGGGAKVPGCPACESEADELREISRIETWRRGIANAEAGSVGTAVDGEFITPHASRALIDSGRLAESDLKPPTVSSHRKRRSKSSRSKTGSSTVKSREQPSGLRMFFKTRS